MRKKVIACDDSGPVAESKFADRVLSIAVYIVQDLSGLKKGATCIMGSSRHCKHC